MAPMSARAGSGKLLKLGVSESLSLRCVKFFFYLACESTAMDKSFYFGEATEGPGAGD